MAIDYEKRAAEIKLKRTTLVKSSVDYQKRAQEIIAARGTATNAVKTAGRVFAPSTALKRPAGLQNIAERAGLGKEAQDIIANRGESPDKYWSGGLISDTFDTLNTLSHGMVGLLKGKGFAEGVKTRESFTKGDTLQADGIAKLIVGVALDIAVDPLTYIAPATVVTKLSKIPALAKGARAVSAAASQNRIADTLGRGLVYRFGQDPIYRKMDEDRILSIGRSAENIVNLIRPIAKLSAPVQKQIGEARKLGQLENLPDALKELARPAFDELDKLGKEAVDAGLLSKDVYEENVGTYMARMYRTKEQEGAATKALKALFPSKPMRLDLSRFKARKDIPEEVREAMGEILEAGYPTAKSMVQLKNAIENAKFFKAVSQAFASDELVEGMAKLPVTDRLGELSGRVVPQPIADSINEIVRAKSNYQKVQGAVVGGFKFSKVILNPATHARNVMSNLMLNYWEGLNPLTPAGAKAYALAAKELTTAGPMYREAKSVGLGLDNFSAAEIKDFLDSSAVGTLGSRVKSALDSIANAYQKEEEFAKMAQYIFQRTEKGLSPEDAWQVAERATFNYAKVTPFIRHLREAAYGFPFITFTYKATPQVANTVYKTPTKISNFGKIKNAIENKSDPNELAAERETEPDWIKSGYFIKLPMKDAEGRSAYFDLTYILPFGDLVSGQYLERQPEEGTGLKESVVRSAARKSPFINLATELTNNKDFYGDQIFRLSDPPEAQLKDVFRHILKTYAPPLLADQIPGNYDNKGERRKGTIQKRIAGEAGPQTRTFFQEAMKNIGLKINPIDLATQASYSEKDIVHALQTLLEERGIIQKAEIPFVPKRR